MCNAVQQSLFYHGLHTPSAVQNHSVMHPTSVCAQKGLAGKRTSSPPNNSLSSLRHFKITVQDISHSFHTFPQKDKSKALDLQYSDCSSPQVGNGFPMAWKKWRCYITAPFRSGNYQHYCGNRFFLFLPDRSKEFEEEKNYI